MKHIISIIAFISLSVSVNAQQKPCLLIDGKMHEVFVFSENRNQNLTDLFGERINPMVLNVVFITTEKQKEDIDKQCMKGELQGAVFIYPAKDVAKIIRYCTVKDYVEALNRNEKLEIEKLYK